MMMRSFRCAVFAVLASWPAFAQSAETSGFTLYEKFQGSASSLGWVNELDTSLGYNFGAHFSVDGGIPIYFVRPSSSTTATTGATSSNGIGNVYAQLRLTLNNPILNFVSTVTGTAPTGDKAIGFSTGHATVDWSNYFDHSFSRLTPFLNVGIANSVSDTMFFVRPYTTYGMVTHVEGGARYRLVRPLSIGVSVYGIKPSGQQTVVSRLVKGQNQSAPAPGNTSGPGSTNGNGQTHGVFETANVTTGSANIAQDHGFSTWVQLAPTRTINLYAGYTRSAQYSLNTFFYGIGFNLGKAVRSLGF